MPSVIMIVHTSTPQRYYSLIFFFFEAEDGIRDAYVTGVQTCAFFFSSRRRHTRCLSDWSSDVCSSDLSPRRCRCRTVATYPQGRNDPMPRPLAGAFVCKSVRIQRLAPSSRMEQFLLQIGRASCRERV